MFVKERDLFNISGYMLKHVNINITWAETVGN